MDIVVAQVLMGAAVAVVNRLCIRLVATAIIHLYTVRRALNIRQLVQLIRQLAQRIRQLVQLIRQLALRIRQLVQLIRQLALLIRQLVQRIRQLVQRIRQLALLIRQLVQLIRQLVQYTPAKMQAHKATLQAHNWKSHFHQMWITITIKMFRKNIYIRRIYGVYIYKISL